MVDAGERAPLLGPPIQRLWRRGGWPWELWRGERIAARSAVPAM